MSNREREKSREGNSHDQLRCPYCLRRRSADNTMMHWCIRKCESDPDQERQAKGFVEADEIINGGEGAFRYED